MRSLRPENVSVRCRFYYAPILFLIYLISRSANLRIIYYYITTIQPGVHSTRPWRHLGEKDDVPPATSGTLLLLSCTYPGFILLRYHCIIDEEERCTYYYQFGKKPLFGIHVVMLSFGPRDAIYNRPYILVPETYTFCCVNHHRVENHTKLLDVRVAELFPLLSAFVPVRIQYFGYSIRKYRRLFSEFKVPMKYDCAFGISEPNSYRCILYIV